MVGKDEFFINYKEALVEHGVESVNLFSPRGQLEQEMKSCVAFLRLLGVQFSIDEIKEGDEPPDLCFRSANFEITEFLGGRKRNKEIKDDLQLWKDADSWNDIKKPSTRFAPVSLNQVVQLITKELKKKTEKYCCINDRKNLDIIVYMNPHNNYLDMDSKPLADLSELKGQNWRSVSFLMVPYSMVIYAETSAPDFLREFEGQIRSEYDRKKDPYFMELFQTR
ncbi:MAG: DUF1780 domain-containing protein [Chloroflexi bacterium]|nr:DUF1780 domain-containing protein [Chloroflexota bacterium]